jgi:Tfp pilus assembly protein PilN
MLRANLATRPFYNERAIHVVLAIAAVLTLIITILNVSRIVTLSRHSTELSSRINQDRAEAQRLTAEAARIRRTINKDELALVVNAAQEANTLIDQRTFSWTEFFNRIEATIPPDVMLTSVRPSFKDGITHVNMIVMARQQADVQEFIEKLEATGSFNEVFAPTSELTEDGMRRATIQSVYEGGPGEPDAAPAAGTPPAPVATPAAPATPSGAGRQSPGGTTTPSAPPPRDRGRQ